MLAVAAALLERDQDEKSAEPPRGWEDACFSMLSMSRLSKRSSNQCCLDKSPLEYESYFPSVSKGICSPWPSQWPPLWLASESMTLHAMFAMRFIWRRVISEMTGREIIFIFIKKNFFLNGTQPFGFRLNAQSMPLRLLVFTVFWRLLQTWMHLKSKLISECYKLYRAAMIRRSCGIV